MSSAQLARTYRRELREAKAKPALAEPVLPPAFQMEQWRSDMLCDLCRGPTSIVWKQTNGERVRRCEACEAK